MDLAVSLWEKNMIFACHTIAHGTNLRRSPQMWSAGPPPHFLFVPSGITTNLSSDSRFLLRFYHDMSVWFLISGSAWFMPE